MSQFHLPGQHPWDDPTALQNALAGRPDWTYGQPVVQAIVDPNSPFYGGPDGQQRYYWDRESQAQLQLMHSQQMQAMHHAAMRATAGSGGAQAAPIVTIL